MELTMDVVNAAAKANAEKYVDRAKGISERAFTEGVVWVFGLIRNIDPYVMGYNAATANASNWIKSQSDFDIPVKSNEKGELMSEEYMKNLQGAMEYLEGVVSEFKNYMEDNL